MSHPRTLLGASARYLWNTFVVVLVSIAVLLSVARLLLPEASGYRESVEHWVSVYLGQPVHITTMDVSLEGLTPTVTLRGVQLMDVANKRVITHFRELRIGIHLLASLRRRQLVPADLTVVGADLVVTRSTAGKISVRGMRIKDMASTAEAASSQGVSNQLLRWLFQRNVLALRDSRIQWRDLRHGAPPVLFSDVNLWLHNRGERHQLTGDVRLPRSLGKRLKVAIDMHGDVLKPASLGGRFYLLGEGLRPERIGAPLRLHDATVRAAALDFQLWGRWAGRHLTRLSGTVDANQLTLSSLPAVGTPLSLTHASARLRWLRTDRGWQLDMDHVRIGFADHAWPVSQLQVVRTLAAPGRDAGVTIGASYLRLDDLSDILRTIPLLDAPLRTSLAALAPRGVIHGVRVHWQTPPGGAPVRYQVQARFSALSVKAEGRLPGIQRAGGTLWMDNTHGELRLDSTQGTLTLPHLFRQPLSLNRLAAVVNWQQRAGIWYVHSRDFQLRSPDLRVRGDLLLEMAPKASPYLELLVRFDHGDASKVSAYLPAGIMDADTVKWLDQAFISGQISEGGMVFNGRLADFPFLRERGRFLVRFKAKNLLLNYQPGWPRLHDLEARARFTGQGLAIDLMHGLIGGGHLKGVRVGIARFSRPVLTVQGTVQGSTADVVRFLADSPLAHSARKALNAMDVTGKSKTDIVLHIPLSARLARSHPLAVTGQIRLMDSRLQLLDRQLDISHINGVLHFTQHTQRANNIRATLFGAPVRIDVYGPTNGRRTIIAARGHFVPAALRKNSVFRRNGVDRWLRLLQGTTPWRGTLTLERGKHAIPVRLRVTSELQGLAVVLPAPLGKAARDTRTLAVDMDIIRGHPRLNVSLAGIGALVLALQQRRGRWHLARAEVNFSSTEAALPARPVFLIKGSLRDVSPTLWLGVADKLSTSKDGARRSAYTSLPLVFNMDRLYLTDGQKRTSSHGGRRKVLRTLAPREVPLISGEIRDLRYGQIALGRLRVRTRREQDGLLFNALSLRGAYGQIKAQGRWSTRGTTQRSEFRAELKSDDFGAYLHALGFAPVMSGGKADIKFALHWPAPPFDFSPATLAGKVDVQITDGTITQINPGAGRLFGLLSLSALPRRLSLDFGDVFKKGLGFDKITGSFNIAHGNAMTDNLKLTSPSSNIHLRGRTGLVAHDYDQWVTVVPQIGSTLPLVGGLAMGAQVGAIILLFQKLFKPSIDKVAQYQYRITGSWAHPDITRLRDDKAAGGKPG